MSFTFDSHANAAFGLVVTPPSPPTTGTTMGLSAGAGALMPAVPFNATVGQGRSSEIVRVLAITGDNITSMLRAQEGTTALAITAGMFFGNSITVKALTDIESAINALPPFAIQSLSAGAAVATGPQIVFSNSNGVSFGLNGNTLTASVLPGGAGLSAGLNSQNTGTVNFANGNGVTFGLSNNGTMTASVRTDYQSSGAYLTTAMASNAATISAINFSAGTTSQNLSALTMSNGNGISFGLNGSVITATVATNYQSQGAYLTTAMQSNAATISNFNFSAGTTSQNLSNLVFANSNGVSFGLNGSTITASAAGVGGGGAAVSAGANSQNTGTVNFANSNGISFGLSNNGTLTASYTVPSTAGLISNINLSAGTTSANLSALTFANSNGLSFGLNAGTVTASYTVPSVAGFITTARASNDAIGLNTALTANGVSVTANSSGLSLNFPAFLTTAMQSNAATISNLNFSAGTTSQNLSKLTFADSNGISFGLNGSVVTATVVTSYLTSQSNQAFSASGGSSAFQTLVFSNGSGVTFSNSNGSLMATVATNYQSQGAYLTTAMASNAATISNVNISAGTTSGNLSAMVFSNLNGVSFGLNGSVVTASVGVGGGGGAAISAGANSQNTGTVNFANGNGVTFGLSNNGTMTASVTAQGYATSTAGGGGMALTFNSSGLSISHEADSYFTGWQLAGNTSGTSSSGLTAEDRIYFSGGNGVTLSGSSQSLVFSVATNYQSQGAYLTTARASNDAIGLNTALTANGVAWTVNSSGLSLSVPAFLTTAMASNAATISNINVSAGTTSRNVSALTFGNAGGVSFGYDGTNVTAVAPAGAPSPVNFSAGTTSNNLASVVFSNSNGISFGLNGSTITMSHLEATLSQWDLPAYGSSMQTNSTLANNSLYFQPFDLDQYVNAYRINFFASVGTQSGSTQNSTWAAGHTASMALYARDSVISNSTQITSFWSCSFFLNVSGSSNTNMTATVPFGISNSTAVSTQQGSSSTFLAQSVGGFRVIPVPISSTLSPGRYWLAFAQSTGTTNTNMGSFNLSYLQQSQGNLAFRPFGISSAASNASFLNFYEGLGTYSATSNVFPGTVVMNSDRIRAGTANTRVFFNISGYTTATNML